ncbi:MAG: 23S rRNA (uracil(1939)-C(5))-methyltransferase RlmD [Bacteroidetes bacterium]|nr:MAG: 23S rRNA (uracil(1939)-C(5))-methyltransferase RlmD [Bacteroidota bacterium]
MRVRKKNIVLENVTIADYAAEGKSLAKIDGKVIFVDNAIPGDIVDIRLSKNKKDWAEGHAIEFKEYSADRIQPFCSHFGVCGGCQWQMLPYEKQLFYKQKQVLDVLQRIGKLPLPEMEPIAGADMPVRYRNKMEYTFGTRRFLLPGELNREDIKTDQPVAGFHAKGLFDKIVDIDICWLQEEPSNDIRKAIRNYALENGISFYDIRQHQGSLRTIQLRICTTGEIMVNIVVGEIEKQVLLHLLEFVAKSFPQITTLLYTINNKKNDSLYDLEPRIFSGKGYVIEKLEEFKFKVGPKSFFQTNTRQGEKLYQVAREFAELSGKETVYDLYCGTGSIGIFLGNLAGKLVGVETIEEAIGDARENAALNSIEGAAFFSGDVNDICTDEFFGQHGKPDVIITDPPRAGMHEKLVKKLLQIEAPTIVYVSCNPATQARDLNGLAEKYEVTRIRPVDMFPHTHHIENVAQLKLKRI